MYPRLEYTDCIPCRGGGVKPLKKCLEFDTKLHLMVRLQFWRFVKCCHYSLLHARGVLILSLGVSCMQDCCSYLWTLLPAAGTSGKNWPIRDKDGKHLKSFATILKILSYAIAGWNFCLEDVSCGLPTLASLNKRSKCWPEF